MLYRQNIHSWDGHGQCSSSKSHRGHGNMGCFENRMHPKNHYGVLYSLNQNGHKQDFWLNGILWPYVICDFDSINREPIQSSSIFRQTYLFFCGFVFQSVLQWNCVLIPKTAQGKIFTVKLVDMWIHGIHKERKSVCLW